MAPHVHSFVCPETDHGDYHGRHANNTPASVQEAARLEHLVHRFPMHPISKYVGTHVTSAEWLRIMEGRRVA